MQQRNIPEFSHKSTIFSTTYSVKSEKGARFKNLNMVQMQHYFFG